MYRARSKTVECETKRQVVRDERWFDRKLLPDELRDFIHESRTTKQNKKAYIGDVTPEASRRILEICGYPAAHIMLESEAIRHSYRTSTHKLADNDLLYIPEIINTSTTIKLSSEKHQNNLCLEFRKNIDGKITIVEEIRVNYDGWLALVTCYRE
jgi:hypothetical protein